MIRNMESAAADTIEALLVGSPPLEIFDARPEDCVLVGQMAQIMTDLHFAGLPTTRHDLETRGFSAAEIDRLALRAGARARTAIQMIAERGIRRARVPAGRA